MKPGSCSGNHMRRMLGRDFVQFRQLIRQVLRVCICALDCGVRQKPKEMCEGICRQYIHRIADFRIFGTESIHHHHLYAWRTLHLPQSRKHWRSSELFCGTERYNSWCAQWSIKSLSNPQRPCKCSSACSELLRLTSYDSIRCSFVVLRIRGVGISSWLGEFIDRNTYGGNLCTHTEQNEEIYRNIPDSSIAVHKISCLMIFELCRRCFQVGIRFLLRFPVSYWYTAKNSVGFQESHTVFSFKFSGWNKLRQPEIRWYMNLYRWRVTGRCSL